MARGKSSCCESSGEMGAHRTSHFPLPIQRSARAPPIAEAQPPRRVRGQAPRPMAARPRAADPAFAAPLPSLARLPAT